MLTRICELLLAFRVWAANVPLHRCNNSVADTHRVLVSLNNGINLFHSNLGLPDPNHMHSPPPAVGYA